MDRSWETVKVEDGNMRLYLSLPDKGSNLAGLCVESANEHALRRKSEHAGDCVSCCDQVRCILREGWKIAPLEHILDAWGLKELSDHSHARQRNQSTDQHTRHE